MNPLDSNARRPATLVEGMLATAATYRQSGFTFQNAAGVETFYRFPELLAAVERSAAGLQQLGLVKGDRLALLTQDPEDFVLTFLGAVRVGIVPMPLYPPPPLGGIEAHMRQVAALLETARPRALVGSGKTLADLKATLRPMAFLEKTTTPEDIRAASGPLRPCEILPDDAVFLQFTSGSTATPRGAIVTHRTLVANIVCFMGEALQADPTVDKGISWLPLYHDMGLIGFVLGPVYWGVPVVIIPTLRFAKTPAAWLDAIHVHRGTITFAPNFAFALLLRRLKTNDVGRWDLSSVKALGCGAEPIRADLIARFLEVFTRGARLRPNVFMPAYGLAESTLAVALKRLGMPTRIQRTDRALFEQTGLVTQPRQGHAVLEHVGCGGAFAGHEIAIRGPEGRDLPAGNEGEIWVRGPSVCAGYVGDHSAWDANFHQGWLNTGDLGYLLDGELFVSGRSKDLIILNGRNVHPQPIEWAVGDIQGVRPQSVVAFAVASDSSEMMVIVLETQARASPDLVVAVEEVVQDLVATRPSDVVFLPPGALPKTTSGKLKRAQVRRDYLDGRLPRLGSVAAEWHGGS
jgi:fatty-acyl-CoA synthase